jgi:hypothetical protein
MVKILKMIVICALGSMAMSSCLGNKENSAQVYVEVYSVIKSNMGAMYFASDDGIDLYPVNGFDPKWGNVGDRILVGFNYDPYSVSETTTSINITVENLTGVPTHNYALPPSSVDTVGSGVFLFENSSDKHAISAWAVQNYLTVIFSIRYSDASKHTFGFIEEPELFRNDTLFLSLWHNTKEEGKSSTIQSHIALNLSNYSYYLSARDSAIISIKYKAENMYSSEPGDYTYPVIYRKKYNIDGY